MGNIRFNIESGAKPFIVKLLGSDKDDLIINEYGETIIYDVSNGIYELNITDSNGCIFNKEMIVNPNITTTTTTKIDGKSLIIGHAQDELVIFNEGGTNRNSEYNGYPDGDVVELYLWFKTFDGEPLDEQKLLNLEINGEDDSSFNYVVVSDQIHVDTLNILNSVENQITGQVILKEGFIESYFKYILYKGNNNPRYSIRLYSSLPNIYTDINTRIDDGKTYGIENITNNEILLKY